MNLNFKPLSDSTSFILNAVVQVNDYFNLSISYNDPNRTGLWYVGEKGNYEVAIQASPPGDRKYRSLIEFKDCERLNIFPGTSDAGLEGLFRRASKLEYAGEIEVFAHAEGNKERAWGHRFYCAKGYDLAGKTKYVSRVFSGEDKWRFIPFVMSDVVHNLDGTSPCKSLLSPAPT